MNAHQSIRPFLEWLDRTGDLLRVPDTVDPFHEVSACLSLADRGPALLFEAVAGSPLRIAGNLLAGRERIAAALGIAPAEISERILRSIREPIWPVSATHRAVQAVVERDAPLAALPVPTFFEREERPYITAGVILARDPETGRGNASFARVGLLDGRTALVGIAPNHHLALFARRAAARGRPLDIAVVLGAHPAIQLAACLYLGVGDDELECAGSLLGAPVELIDALTVDLRVPAGAEIVLEGRIDANVSVPEGFISEYHGMYENYGPGVFATFSAMTRREDAILQVIEPGYHREHIYLGALPIAAGLLHGIAKVVPNVRDVAVTEAGAGRTDVVVQLDAPRPGQARRAIHAAFAAVSLVKRVTVVDVDIDPWDPVMVDWARMNRMKLERDLMLFPHSGTDRSEPMEEGGLVTKAGLDATAKPSDRAEGIERALPPAAALASARERLRACMPRVPAWLSA
ncbi:UbiD family decarboxylase [Flavisphingomonas formosensis]|uniref:UbiD family decarboxylase n=1 Tax=Flavisphingomonas formosensis TaxID=861534 RepID=UPI0012FBA216|nr:UbiD family decarboxylase [Sphingomonas formosensis]